MGLSPRTLRPANNFTPRSIAGLALWLDASDASSLYTTDAGAVTAVSAPTDITGCVGWWDASDAASITQSGGLVSQWNDRSGQGNHATASTTARPTTGTRSLNGRNVIDFDGTANSMATSLADTATQTVLFVAVSDVASGGRVWSFGTTNRGVFSDSGIWSFWRQQTAGAISFGATASSTSPSVACALFSSNSSLTTFGNGAQGATNDPVDSSGGLFNIGKESTSFHNGYIAEIIVFNTALTTAQRASVEAYLAAKWGISGVHAQATATSDPVGAWLDKSGNARHVTQGASATRPTISATVQNGRRVLAFSGSKTLSRPSYTHENGLPGLTRYMVLRASSVGATIPARVNGGGGSDVWVQTVSGVIKFAAGTASVSVASPSYLGLATGTPHILGSVYAGTAATLSAGLKTFFDGSPASGDVSGTLPASLPTGTPELWIGSNINANNFWNNDILEVISYSRALSASERQKLERHLAAKWGVVITPQVSNADAQDWIGRVYAAGGTVSSTTASAVNTFCDSLDAASLRDRFYRLNLFCGGSSGTVAGLAACLVPLYRGPSLGGTQYGSSTDANNGPFAVADYAETGAGGGLLGNGTSKYLNTGLTVSDIGTAASGHMSVYHGQSSGLNSNRYYMGVNDASTSNRFYFGTDSFSTASVLGMYGSIQGANQSLAANGHGAAGHRILSRETESVLTQYHNGSVVGTNAVTITPAVSTAAFAVFAANRNGTVDRFHNSWIAAYSIGLGLNSTQAANYRTIMQTFQTALGRQV